MAYTKEMLRELFQSTFDLEQWKEVLQHLFKATQLRQTPEEISGNTSDKGYFLGSIETTDYYRIGLFFYKITEGSVTNKRVGLRSLVKSFINPTWGVFDAALVVFDDGKNWRLSFICDIKEESTTPKRYTFVFGNEELLHKTAIERFTLLQGDMSFKGLKEAFSVEALTKEFYKELFDWYQWAIEPSSNITFPNNTTIEDDDRDDIETKVIRMITRIMFVWFIKQKHLVPDKIFDVDFLTTILKDFDPHSTAEGNYYNAILQNLFFGTLNRAIKDEEGNTRRFATSSKRDIKTLYRYAEMFTIGEQEVINIFAEIPFLNGGLFECLDKTKSIDGVEQCYNFDGFSRNDARFADGRYKHRAVVPNNLFFHPEKGLISILSRYNFTIEENSPEEQQVALDPELLGKVFENLLGAYNPETQETARNQSGSFYTPREIVNYMVDESLIAYLGNDAFVRSVFHNDFVFDQTQKNAYQKLADKLKAVKVLDPACGSGAFPMGLLNRMVQILERIAPKENIYNLKLSIIENCLYGSDIQSIAAQITKLRFFISLICDCEWDTLKPNFGIPTLPNLETKFVSANSLITKKKKAIYGNLFENPEIELIKNELAEIRHKHFSAKSTSTKYRLRDKDQELREKLAKLLSDDDNFAPEDAMQLAAWNPYDQNAVSPFFDPKWMFGVTDGFDIVIGNPPYIQLQKNGGELTKLYEQCSYSTLVGSGDIYCLFYERGFQLLKDGGYLCYITSNKWMRAGYGKAIRDFFVNKTNPILLIDFAGVKVFESATVDTNILLYSKSSNEQKTVCAVANKQNKDCLNNLSLFIEQESSTCAFSSSDSWVILSPIEQSIKRKIEAVGTPLKDWDIQIYRGVLTGCNEAFIIDTAKRDEILSNCQTEEERKKTDELIRPILRGRDIKRYGYEWADLWLIATFPSRHYNIDEYPAVKQYLLSFGIERLEQTGKVHNVNGERIKSRKKTNNKWFETQDSICYWEDFDKPKIIYPNMTKYLPFVFDNSMYLTNQKCFIVTGKYLAYLTAFFNSSLFKYCFRDSFPELQGGTRELNKDFFDKIPVYVVSDAQNLQYQDAVEDIQQEYTKQKAQRIDSMLFDLYNLSSEERATIGFVEIV